MIEKMRRSTNIEPLWNSDVDVPMPQPPTAGQTETLIPLNALPEFETFTTYAPF